MKLPMKSRFLKLKTITITFYFNNAHHLFIVTPVIAIETMATGANTAPLGKLHPVLAAKYPTRSTSNSRYGDLIFYLVLWTICSMNLLSYEPFVLWNVTAVVAVGTQNCRNIWKLRNGLLQHFSLVSPFAWCLLSSWTAYKILFLYVALAQPFSL